MDVAACLAGAEAFPLVATIFGTVKTFVGRLQFRHPQTGQPQVAALHFRPPYYASSTRCRQPLLPVPLAGTHLSLHLPLPLCCSTSSR